MMDYSKAILEELQAIKELMSLMAEPAIAQRDQKHREALRSIVGKSKTKQMAVLLMDGTMAQKEIHDRTKIHRGNLSTLVTALRDGGLLDGNSKQPKLTIAIPGNFFEVSE